MISAKERMKPYTWSWIVVVGLISFLVFLSYAWVFTADDTFIGFRYSKNFAEGNGLTWNVGEDPVEGYTDFLRVMIMAGSEFVGLDMFLMSKLIGLLSMVGIIALFKIVSRDVLKGHSQKTIMMAFFVASAIFLSNPATAVHSVSGMGTMLFSFLFFSMVYLAYRLINKTATKTMIIFSIGALIISLLRPEGIALSFILFILVFLFTRKRQSVNWLRNVGLFSIFYIIPEAIYMLWRVSYFNELYPIPFILKTMTHGGFLRGLPTFMRVLGYLTPFLVTIIFSALILFEFSGSDKNKQSGQRFWRFLITGIVGSVSVAAIYIFSVMMMNFAQRYYFPTFQLAYIIAGIAVAVLYERLTSKKSTVPNILKVGGIIVLIFVMIAANVYFIGHLIDANQYGIGINRGHITLGKALNKYNDLGLTIALIDQGALPFYSEWRIADMGGLNDKYVARNGIADLDYIETVQHPDMVIFMSSQKKFGGDIIPLHDDQQMPYYEYAQNKGFQHIGSVLAWNNYYLVVYLDPNLESFDDIRLTVRNIGVPIDA
jgi:hypothetical protein